MLASLLYQIKIKDVFSAFRVFGSLIQKIYNHSFLELHNRKKTSTVGGLESGHMCSIKKGGIYFWKQVCQNWHLSPFTTPQYPRLQLNETSMRTQSVYVSDGTSYGIKKKKLCYDVIISIFKVFYMRNKSKKFICIL